MRESREIDAQMDLERFEATGDHYVDIEARGGEGEAQRPKASRRTYLIVATTVIVPLGSSSHGAWLSLGAGSGWEKSYGIAWAG